MDFAYFLHFRICLTQERGI